MIYVGSLKYSPVFKSHCCAFGKACEEEGYKVKYLFSRRYEWMLPQSIREKTVFIGNSNSIYSMIKDRLNPKNIQLINKLFSTDNPTHVYLHNYHFLNHPIASVCKKNGGKFIYHVHEPYVENKSAHGGFQRYWLHLSEYMGAKLLKKTDVAVISSDEGVRLFEKAFPWFEGKKMKIPLLYEDLGEGADASQRKYITFVGPPVPAKNPEKFLDIVKCSNDRNLNFRFLLISWSEIKDPKYLNHNNMEISKPGLLTDEDFGKLVKQSIAVITPYKRETQSSVILVSYMYGTPVISSNIGGLPEFVSEGETGYLVPPNEDTGQWLDRISRVQENLPELSRNSRKYFIDNFSEDNWKNYLDKLLPP